LGSVCLDTTAGRNETLCDDAVVAERTLPRARAAGEQAFRELIDPYRGSSTARNVFREFAAARGEERTPVRISMTGITPSTITSPAPGPGSWTEIRLGARVHRPHRRIPYAHGPPQNEAVEHINPDAAPPAGPRTDEDKTMGKTIMGAVVSPDGFIADDNDDVGPLRLVRKRHLEPSGYRDMATVVIGRRLFDLTNGWGGKPAAGEDVFVATHQPPTDWEHADTAPFTFVDGVERRLPPPRSSPGTGTSTWPPVRSAARRSNSG
jgi:hypothetical protein